MLENALEMPKIQLDNRCNKTLSPKSLEIKRLSENGLNTIQIASKLCMTHQGVAYHLKQYDNHLAKMTGNTDLETLQRDKLTARLPKTLKVFDKVLKLGLENDASFNHLKLANDTSLKLNTGLNVLSDSSETPQVINYEDKRIQVIAKLDLADQFGAAVSEPIRAEIVENSDQTGDKQRDSDSQAVVSDDSPMNVSRADKSGQPDIPSTT